MRHIIFSENTTYPIAILIKQASFREDALRRNYVEPLMQLGINEADVIAFTLAYNQANKASAGFMKEYLQGLLKALDSLGTKYLYCPDSNYFKALTGVIKVDSQYGYSLPCKIKGYEHMQVVLGINHSQLFYNPEIKERLNFTLNALADAFKGTYIDPGKGIIQSAQYPTTIEDIKYALDQLHQYSSLACDIETFSLRFTEAGIGTIAFAWDQHNGIAFPCDWEGELHFNRHIHVRRLLKEFFETYQGNLKFHRGAFDIKCLVYALWMKDALDTEGLLTGLEFLTRNVDDTLLIAYLATNTTAGNQLGLKFLSQEFAGNYAVEVKDISKVPLENLLEYNLLDTLCTNYVYDKFYPIMVQDQQEELYKGLFKDSLKLIIQLELTGMPLSRKRIQEVKAELGQLQKKSLDTIFNSHVVKMATLLFQEKAWDNDYFSRVNKAKNPDKIKRKPREAFNELTFNPNSGPQLQTLLYEHMDLPVIDTTGSGAPATGADTIEKLYNHTSDQSYKDLLKALIDYGKVNKILTTFIPAFEGAISKDDSDTVWLHGSFNLGGTVSGRLSSSEPNLQNLPAGSTYGKLIKSCFVSPEGWIFAGADFNALEDRINALLTKDPNKLKVFTDGYDSHCLRAFYFFPDQLPGIIDDVHSINSIKDVFPNVRQAAKSPAFALQYAGTWRTLVNNLGFSKELAQNIETNFGKMYKVSADWVAEKIQEASRKGYATTAFGLRIRTPLLEQVVLGTSKTPHEAEAEARTLGNAISGQSYGLLNNRALVAFMKKVWDSPYRTQILPVAMIHDASYLVIRDDLEVVTWVNNHLTEEMKWQGLPEIQHPKVTLGAELDLFYKGWHQPITLKNNMSPDMIIEHVTKEKQLYDKKA